MAPSISAYIPNGNARSMAAGTPGNLNIESGLQRATDQNAAFLNTAKELYEPYSKSGAASLDEYMKLLLGGVDSLQTGDKNFSDMMALSEKNVMANRATSGLLRSGATAAALNDSNLNFQNNYYGNRLNQLRTGVGIGEAANKNMEGIYDKLGANQTNLASALAQIQIEREGMASNERAANLSADASKYAAKNSGGFLSNLLGGLF